MIDECSKSYLVMEEQRPSFNFTSYCNGEEYVFRYPGHGKPVLVGRLVKRIGNELPENVNPEREGIIKLGEDVLSTGEYVKFEKVSEEEREEIIKNLGK